MIPQQTQEAPKEGTVIAVGPGRLGDNGERFPVHVDEGDYVVFANYAGQAVKIDGEEYLILREEDLLGKVRG